MSENRDETTGQFASEPTALFGKAALESDAGYVPMPEEPTGEDKDELTLEEAAEKLTQQSHTAESDIVTHAPFDLPDNMTMTVEQAAKAIADADAADANQTEQEEADKLRKEVDELRGVKPEQEAKPEEAKPAETQPAKDGELDPEIEKALSNPKIKEAIAAQISEAENVRQTYSKATDLANEFARASFIENFPEIANLPLPQWESALAAMAQQEPDRFNKAVNSLRRVVQLQSAQQQQQQQRAFQERQQFQAYSKAEDARFAEMMKGESPAQMRAVEAEVPKMLAEYGADAKLFLEAIGLNSTFPRATAERIMVDAAKYRMMQQAAKAVPAKPLPPVQRPGTARSHSEARSESARAIAERFNSNPSLKNAADLLAAQRKARG